MSSALQSLHILPYLPIRPNPIDPSNPFMRSASSAPFNSLAYQPKIPFRIPVRPAPHHIMTLLRSLAAASRRLSALPPALAAPHSRQLASSTSTPSSISAVLSAAATTSPLKDAIKFHHTSQKATTWTFRELTSHVDALSNGLHHLGYRSGDVVLTLLSPHSPEHAVLLLAAARLRLTLVSHNASDTSSLPAAIAAHSPSAMFIPGAVTEGDVVAAANPILSAVAPSLAPRDAAGLAGLVPLTGRSLRSASMPSLRHIVHTGDRNVRATVTFRSLLVYQPTDPAPPSNVAGSDPLVVSGPGAIASEKDVLKQAVAIAGKMDLAGDHALKNGKIIVTPDGSPRAVSTAVAALMRQALWVSADADMSAQVATTENALVA